MSSSLYILFFSLLITLSGTKVHPKPKTLILPVRRHTPTHLYVTSVYKKNPHVPLKLVIDINGASLWANCEKKNILSTHPAPDCHPFQCSAMDTHSCRMCLSRPGCHNNTCSLVSVNPVNEQSAVGEVSETVIFVRSIGKFGLGNFLRIPHFLFVCAPTSLLHGHLPQGVKGFAGFGQTQFALPAQLATHFGLEKKFSVCLGSKGFVAIGKELEFAQFLDEKKQIDYTPLIISPEGEYYINVNGITINDDFVPINTSLLLIDRHGFGGTKISTTEPYTILHSSLFKAVTEFYMTEFYKYIPTVSPVAPFGLCFNSSTIWNFWPFGIFVPNLDLVLEKRRVLWRFFGTNVVVRVTEDVMCLAFVDGGLHPKASIVIGAHQLEDSLLVFDLSRSRVGFTSSLLYWNVTCANFTSIAKT